MHGFTDVDSQSDPNSWVALLDRLTEEPFYRAYQQRVRELLRPSPGGHYLDVGAGTGASAARLRDDHGVSVIAVDHAQTTSVAIPYSGNQDSESTSAARPCKTILNRSSIQARE